MTTAGRGQVWTSEQLAARLTALRGLVPAAVQHIVYRATSDAAAYAHEGYLIPGEVRRLTPEAFDFWLAKRDLAGVERLSVAVMVIRERLVANGNIQDCELEYRRGAVDGPYHGSPARITFTGPARLARFYQATPEGALAEVAPTPGAAALPGPEIDTLAAMRLAVQANCGEGARILDTREPTVIEAMVGIATVLHVIQTDGREVTCGIIWHGPTAVALQADFPRFRRGTDPFGAPVRRARRTGCRRRAGRLRDPAGRARTGRRRPPPRNRRSPAGAVPRRRRRPGDRHTVARHAVPIRTRPPRRADPRPGTMAALYRNLRGVGVLDAYRDGTSDSVVVLTGGADGAVWRHHVDIDGIETWRRADTGSAVGILYGERIHGAAAPPEPPAPARAPPAPELPAAPFGDAVETRFPASAYDIDEAATCLALRRPTAAVFHCQAVLRQGLRAHARWHGVAGPPAQDERRWQAILSDLRDAGGDSGLVAALDAVRRGWRGATLQVGPKYTEEEAERIFRLVEAFMRRLAELCDEDGAPAVPPEGKTG